MKKTYIVANVFWLVLAMAICLESWRLNVGGVPTGPARDSCRFTRRYFLGILAFISLVQTLIKGPGGPGVGDLGGIRFGKLILMIGSLFLYTLLLVTSWGFCWEPFSSLSSFSGSSNLTDGQR